MRRLPPLHSRAKPISTGEFAESLGSLLGRCRLALGTAAPRCRPIAIALSGGVDSMALAYLVSSLPPGLIPPSPIALIVDHGLRPTSSAEARAVRDVARDVLRLRPRILPLSWPRLLGRCHPLASAPHLLPDIETQARRGRFRALGRQCAAMGVRVLLLGHHQDDDYETVLMRLAAGHGRQGLRGISPLADVPECEGIYGAGRSGGGGEEPDSHHLFSLVTESGGLTIIRPLLDFSKARLVATCVASSIPWFEDHTNADPTLTPRNALRHLLVAHQDSLPAALGKRPVLFLARRLRRLTEMAEQEATLQLIRTRALRRFSSNSGTALVALPDMPRSTSLRPTPTLLPYSKQRRRLRRTLRLAMASAMIRQIMALVSPHLGHPTPSQLSSLVPVLFGSSYAAAGPKPFAHSSIMFVPKTAAGSRLAWHLSRVPFTSAKIQPPAEVTFRIQPSGSPGADDARIRAALARQPPWLFSVGAATDGWYSSDHRFRLWDGRFWIRVSSRLEGLFRVAPLTGSHLSRLRAGLDGDIAMRRHLDALLREHAPAKSRWTLPALYVLWESGPGERPQPAGRADDDEVGDMTLLALPSLRVDRPGLKEWLNYEIRYKKVDRRLIRDDVT